MNGRVISDIQTQAEGECISVTTQTRVLHANGL